MNQMTRKKFAIVTLGSLGVYAGLVLGLAAVFPELNLFQPEGVGQVYTALFAYWTGIEFQKLFFMMAYSFMGMFTADLPFTLFFAAFYILIFVWIWAGVRRLRALRRSAWWVLLGFIPYVGVALYLYLLVWPAPGLPSGGENCPACSAPRVAGSAVCEYCGHKFAEK